MALPGDCRDEHIVGCVGDSRGWRILPRRAVHHAPSQFVPDAAETITLPVNGWTTQMYWSAGLALSTARPTNTPAVPVRQTKCFFEVTSTTSRPVTVVTSPE